ncbi:ribosome maturation factor RimM [Clostridium sp. CAG:524]|jgi:16S rRNA processing protein RimM|nr:ribosome maturation factor RimM [Clostridium sp. CAG:524]
MKYIFIGRIVNTHALKGEVRIVSDFEFKDRIFKENTLLYIGENKDKEIIETYRKHKQFDMVKFKGIDYINDVLKYKGSKVYIDESILNLKDDEILISELINMDVYNDNKYVGRITEYRSDNGNNMLRVNNKLIPYNKDFITKIDKENKSIYFHDIGVFL